MNNKILTNDTKETCLSGPPDQIIGNTHHVENGKGCTRLKEVTVWGKKSVVPRGTHVGYPKVVYTCRPGDSGRLAFSTLTQMCSQETRSSNMYMPQILEIKKKNTCTFTNPAEDALTESIPTDAAATGIQQVQHSQLSIQTKENLIIMQENRVTLQNERSSLTAMILQNPRGLDLSAVSKKYMVENENTNFILNSQEQQRNVKKLLKRIEANRTNKIQWNTIQNDALGKQPVSSRLICKVL